MARLFRRIGKYLSTAAGSKFDQLADPKIQLTQAIEEAQDLHRKLKQQAANVIANQKQTEMRLNRAMTDLEKTTHTARQAVLLADQAQQASDSAKVHEYTRVAESLATRMIALEGEVESLKELHLQTTQAADQAKHAVDQNALALQKKLTERQRLLSQLDQAKMQEQLNSAMSQLSEKVGQDVPTFEQVRTKIEERYAKALGAAELNDHSVELQTLEVERAAMDAEARLRLGQLRTQLGLPSPTSELDPKSIGSSADADTSSETGAPEAKRPSRKKNPKKNE